MELILITVIPVFALIATGYGAGRFKLFSEAGEKAISLFVFGFAIPAFLFRTLVRVDATAAPWDLWAAFFGDSYARSISTNRLLVRALVRAAYGPAAGRGGCNQT